VLLLFGPTARSQSAPQSPGLSTAPPATVSIPSYADTPGGLEKLMKDMLNLEKSGDSAMLAAYAKSFELPNAVAWFSSVFGDRIGPGMAASSGRVRSEFELSAPNLLAQLRNEHRTLIQAVRFDNDCDDRATATEYPILLLREHGAALYDVRFSDAQTESVWEYFAYVNGGFRYVGYLERNPRYWSPRRPLSSGSVSPGALGHNDTPSSDFPPRVINILGSIQRAKLIHQVTPVYPEAAKSRHIGGEVILHAVIGKDGEVGDLDVLQGRCIFVEPAVAAIQKWRYQPTVFNGSPVAVDTTITVKFSLKR
jgi:TonB family protein